MLALARQTLGLSSGQTGAEAVSAPSDGHLDTISTSLANLNVSASTATPTLSADLQDGVAKITNEGVFCVYLFSSLILSVHSY